MVIPELLRASGVLNCAPSYPNHSYIQFHISLSLKTPKQNPNPNSTRVSATATSTLVFCSILHRGERLAS
ncbi:hypothetical protein SO802_015988 [Lithocarpus litseifolius]|uniref:Ycf15 protein n=1 Tax=Lithocarpus litseifolius TaxID=425828 RepID=A0AAW2CXG6_9ROSI